MNPGAAPSAEPTERRRGAGLAQWQAMARMARRSILRARLRSVLVVTLVALAVGFGCFVAVASRTSQISTQDRIRSGFGYADLRVDFGPTADSFNALSAGPIAVPRPPTLPGSSTITVQPTDGGDVVVEEPGAWTAEDQWQSEFDHVEFVTELHAQLGAETQLSLSRTVSPVAELSVSPFAHDGLIPLVHQLHAADWSQDLNQQRVTLHAGRLPTADDEVAVPSHQGVDLGDRVTVAGSAVTLKTVGLIQTVPGLDPQTVTFSSYRTGLVTDGALDRLGDTRPWFDYTLVVDTAALDQPTELVLETIYTRVGRSKVNPTSPDRRWARTPAGVWRSTPSEISHSGRAGWISATMVTFFIGAQVAMLAATTWAVGIRRRLREFGQLGVTGADQTQIRQAVLVEAALLGLAAVAVGAAGAVALVAYSVEQGWLDSLGDRQPDGVRLSPMDLVGPSAIGLAASVGAAWWPSKRLTESSPATLLTGGLPIDRDSPYIPRPGAIVAVLAVVLLSGVSMVQGVSLALIPGAIALMLGVLMAIGTILSWFGRRADQLPMLARLVVRTADRQRSRSWTAVGAFVAILTIPIFFGSSIETYPGSYSAGQGDSDQRLFITRPYRGSPDHRMRGEDFVRFDEEFGRRASDVVEPVAEVPLHQVSGQITIDLPGPEDYGSFVGNAVTVLTHNLATALDLSNADTAALDADTVFYQGRWPSVADHTKVTVQLMDHQGRVQSVVYDVEIIAPPHPIGSDTPLDAMIVSEEFATETLGAKPGFGGTVRIASEPLSDAQQAQLLGAADAAWKDLFSDSTDPTPQAVRLDLPHGLEGPTPATVRWITLALTTGLALLLALVTAALTAVESSREMAALIAIGATPASRRKLLAAGTWYSMTIAAVIAIPLAVLVFWAVTYWDDNASGLAVPWVAILAVLFVVPTLVALAVGTFFGNGRPAVTRRLS